MIKIGIKDFFKKLSGERRSENLAFSELLPFIDLSGTVVTVDQAMQIPALAGGVNLISETVAMLPIRLYREESGEITEITGDPRTRLLNEDTGDTLDAYQFKQALVRDFLLQGRGYAYIDRDGNKIRSLHYIPPEEVAVLTNVDVIHKDYNLHVQGKEYAPFDFVKIFRNTKHGWDGRGIIEENGTFLAGAYELVKLEQAQARNGGVLAGFLTSEVALNQEQIDNIKAGWRNMYAKNSGDKVVVLNKGAEFKPAGMTAVEQQLNERKISNAVAISQILRIPAELLAGKYEDDIYSMAIKIAVSPILEAFAKAINRVLLLEKEKGEYFFAFDDRELLKGDTLKRYQAYAQGIESGFLQVDDVRYQENMKPLGLEYVRLGLNDVLYDPKTKEIYTPNTGKSGKVGEEGEEDENRDPSGLSEA